MLFLRVWRTAEAQRTQRLRREDFCGLSVFAGRENRRDAENAEIAPRRCVYLSIREQAPMQELSEEYHALSGSIVGSAIEVHRTLGPGFLESVYEEAMCKELQLRGISYSCQHGCKVDYKGTHVGEGRVDLLVERKIIVELKAVEALAPIHTAQVISYLKMMRLPLGLLFNFNVPILMPHGFRRIILSE